MHRTNSSGNYRHLKGEIFAKCPALMTKKILRKYKYTVNKAE